MNYDAFKYVTIFHYSSHQLISSIISSAESVYQNHSCISSITGAAASAHKQLQRISSISAPGHQQRFKTNWALSDLPGPNLPHPNSSGAQFASARFAAARSAGVQSAEAQFAGAQSARGQFARAQYAWAKFAAKLARGPICLEPFFRCASISWISHSCFLELVDLCQILPQAASSVSKVVNIGCQHW